MGDTESDVSFSKAIELSDIGAPGEVLVNPKPVRDQRYLGYIWQVVFIV